MTSTLPQWAQVTTELIRTIGGFAGIVAVIIAFVVYRHNRVKDARAEWWQRFEWAVGEYHSGDIVRQAVGLETTTLLTLEAQGTDWQIAEVFSQSIESTHRDTSPAEPNNATIQTQTTDGGDTDE